MQNYGFCLVCGLVPEADSYPICSARKVPQPRINLVAAGVNLGVGGLDDGSAGVKHLKVNDALARRVDERKDLALGGIRKKQRGRRGGRTASVRTSA